MKYLWVPTDDSSAISNPSTQTTSLSGSITTASSSFDQVGPGTPGWEGLAATSAGARANAFKDRLATFTSTMTKGAATMKSWSTKYASYKETFTTLDNQYAEAKETYDTATAKLNPADGSEPDLITRIVYGGVQSAASATMDRIRSEHTTTKSQYDTDQSNAANAIRALIPPDAPTTADGAMTFASQQVNVLFEHADADAGQVLGEQIAEELRENGAISEESLALLEDGVDNADFVTALYEEVGAEGIAAMSWQASLDLESSYDDEPERGQRLLDALRTSFTVAADEGLIDDEWLDNFNPVEALPDDLPGGLNTQFPYDMDDDGEIVPLFTGSLLVPLMETNSDGSSKLPSDVLGKIGDHVMADLGAAMNNSSNGLLAGYNAYEDGNQDNPYKDNLFKTVFEQLAHDPMASNDALSGNFETLQIVGRGDFVDDVIDPISQPIADMLVAGTVGLSDANGDGRLDDTHNAFLGDALAARVFLDTAQHTGNDDNYTDIYRQAVGDVVTSKRYFNDAMYSVTAIPRDGMLDTEGNWYDYDSRYYRDGIELDKDVWAAVHQEVMVDPDVAGELIHQTQIYMNEQSEAITNNSVIIGGDEHGADAAITNSLARNEAHRFLMDNFNESYDDLKSELEDIAGDEARANGAISKLIDYAADPTSLPQNLLTDGAKFGAGLLIDQSNDAEQEAVQDSLDNLDSVRDQVELMGEKGTLFRTDAGNLLTGDRGITPVDGVTEGVGSGDPQYYIDLYTRTEFDGSQPYTYDANFLGSNGEPVPVDEMDDAQLQAYEAWLHDPAVQAAVAPGIR